MKVNRLLAMQVAGSVPASLSWDAKRDLIDQKTNGELDTTQLDLLVDLVERFQATA